MHSRGGDVVSGGSYPVPELLGYELLGEVVVAFEQRDLDSAHRSQPEVSWLTGPAQQLVQSRNLLPGITETAQLKQAQHSHQVGFGEPLIVVEGFGERDNLVAQRLALFGVFGPPGRPEPSGQRVTQSR